MAASGTSARPWHRPALRYQPLLLGRSPSPEVALHLAGLGAPNFRNVSAVRSIFRCVRPYRRLSILNVLRTYEELLRNFSVNANAQLAPVCVGEGDERGGDGAGKRLGVNALLTRKGVPAPMTPASERLQSLATANRLLTATTKTAPPRKSTRFAMIRVVPSPT